MPLFSDPFVTGVNGYADWFVKGHVNQIKTPTSGSNAFDLARRLKVKHVRVFQRIDQTLSSDQWFALLEGAKESKIKVTIVVNLSDERYEQVKALLEEKRIATHSALFALDYGEQVAISDGTLYQMRRLFEIVRAKAPQVALTLGGWRSDPKDLRTANISRVQHPADLGRFVDYVDFISVHLYNIERIVERGDEGMKRALTGLLDPLVKAAKGKPIIISEFGAPSTAVPNDFAKAGDPDSAGVAYALLLKILPKMPFDWKVKGAWAYMLLEDESELAKGWGLFTSGGDRLTPAAKALREALGTPE